MESAWPISSVYDLVSVGALGAGFFAITIANSRVFLWALEKLYSRNSYSISDHPRSENRSTY